MQRAGERCVLHTLGHALGPVKVARVFYLIAAIISRDLCVVNDCSRNSRARAALSPCVCSPFVHLMLMSLA